MDQNQDEMCMFDRMSDVVGSVAMQRNEMILLSSTRGEDNRGEREDGSGCDVRRGKMERREEREKKREKVTLLQ